MYFEQIDQPSDVKRLKLNQLETLAAEKMCIRDSIEGVMPYS